MRGIERLRRRKAGFDQQGRRPRRARRLEHRQDQEGQGAFRCSSSDESCSSFFFFLLIVLRLFAFSGFSRKFVLTCVFYLVSLWLGDALQKAGRSEDNDEGDSSDQDQDDGDGGGDDDDDDDDDFEMEVRKLAQEERARAAERLKSPAEVAQVRNVPFCVGTRSVGALRSRLLCLVLPRSCCASRFDRVSPSTFLCV